MHDYSDADTPRGWRVVRRGRCGGVVVWCDGMALPQQSLVGVENALG
ncbi:MAG: hypothetical protein ACK45Y_05800 [Betaproteobacteria bacterium]